MQNSPFGAAADRLTPGSCLQQKRQMEGDGRGTATKLCSGVPVEAEAVLVFTRAEHHAVTPGGWKGHGPELQTGVICFLRLCTVLLHGEHLSS